MFLIELGKKYFYQVIVLIIITGIYFPVLPVGVITLLSLLLYCFVLFLMNRTTRGISFLLFASPVIGFLFSVFNIGFPVYIIFSVLGLFYLKKYNSLMFYYRKSFLKLFFLLLIFFFYYLYGPMHSYSSEKMLYLTVIGFNSLVAWIVFTQSKQVDFFKISKFLITISLLYICIAIEISGYNHPTGILDFNFFRDSIKQVKLSGLPLISYHSVGIAAMYSLTILIGSIKFRFKGEYNFVFILTFFLLLISGARQALLGGILIVFFWLIFNNKFSGLKKIGSVMFFVITLILVGLNTEIAAIKESATSTSMSSALNRNYSQAIEIIMSDPLFGRGLGGYSYSGERGYPHNIVLELLCETGFLGTILIICFLFISLKTERFTIDVVTRSGVFFVLVVFAYLIRAFLSSDLIENIVLFALLLSYSTKYPKYKS